MKTDEEKLEEVFLRLDGQKTDEQEWIDYITTHLGRDSSYLNWNAYKKSSGLVDK